MKKSFLLVAAVAAQLLFSSPLFGMVEEAQKLSSSQVPLSEKFAIFNKMAGYLDRFRSCLSGEGCSTIQSYTLNYMLGAAIGFVQAHKNFEITKADGEHIRVSPSISKKTSLLQTIALHLGYRYLAKKSVNLTRCLTFRGCDAQTKRYLMYNIGLAGGSFAGKISKIIGYLISEQNSSFDPGLVEIKDVYAKKILNLDENKNTFPWYTVLGLSDNATKQETAKQFRMLSLKHHPDKGGYEEASKAINEAYDLSKQLGNQMKRGSYIRRLSF